MLAVAFDQFIQAAQEIAVEILSSLANAQQSSLDSTGGPGTSWAIGPCSVDFAGTEFAVVILHLVPELLNVPYHSDGFAVLNRFQKLFALNRL